MKSRAALGVMGMLLLCPQLLPAQGVAGQGVAAAVQTPLASQQFAKATLPTSGGLANAGSDQAAVLGALTASSLTSITSGMVDTDVSTAQTTAEADGVSILNGLVRAEQVVAVASSWVAGQTAGSSAAGSQLTGLVVNGVSLGDVTPAANTRINLPGVGYVVLNEQTVTGNGTTASGLVVNMIHVVLTNFLGIKTGEVVVGQAVSQVSR